MANNEFTIPIPARLKNVAKGGHVAGAEDIIDDASGLTVSELVGNKDYSPADYSGMGKVVLKKNIVNGVNTLTQAMVNKANTIYVIQYDFTLSEDITIPANCVLQFEGGSLSGEHQITGSETELVNLTKSVFKSVRLAGTFKRVPIINDYVFSQYADDAELFKYMALIGENICLTDGSRYSIRKKTTKIKVNSIFAITNAYLDFLMTEDLTAEGFSFNDVKQLRLENLTVSENYDESDTSAHLTGCTFVVSNAANTNALVDIVNVKFTGVYYSSCVACSGAAKIKVLNCNFDDIKTYDHFIYCSTEIKDYLIQNCSLNNTYSRAGIFKIRAVANCLITLDNVYSNEYKGYFLLLEDLTDTKVSIKNIKVTSTEINGLFSDIKGTDTDIEIIASKIEVQNPGNALFRQNSTTDARINVNIIDCYIVTKHLLVQNGTVSVYNSNLVFKGGFTVVNNIAYRYYNTVIEAHSDIQGICKLYNSTFTDLILINSVIKGTSSYVIGGNFPSDYEDTANVLIVNSSINAAHNLCYSGTNIKYKATITNSEFNGTAWPEWYGACAPVNVNFGTARPTLTSKDKGFQYFDTTLNKPIYWTGSAWVDATGQTV